MSHLVGPITYEQLVKDREEQVKRLTAINAEVEDVTKNRNSIQEFVDNYSAIETTLEASITAQIVTVENNQEALDNANKAISDREDEAEKALDEFKTAEDAVQNKAQLILEMKEKLAELEAEGADPEKIDDLKAKIAAEEAELVDLQSARNVASANKTSTEQALALAEVTYKAAVQASDTSVSTLVELKTQRSDNAENLAAESNRLAEANSVLADLTASQTDAQNEYNDWAGKNQALLDEFEMQDFLRDNSRIIRHINLDTANNRVSPQNNEISAASNVLKEVVKVDMLDKMTSEEKDEANKIIERQKEVTSMPDADTAQTQTLDVIWGFGEVQTAIETAIANGKYEQEFTSLKDSTIHALQVLGYHVYSTINSPDLGQSQMIVSWAKINDPKS